MKRNDELEVKVKELMLFAEKTNNIAAKLILEILLCSLYAGQSVLLAKECLKIMDSTLVPKVLSEIETGLAKLN